MSFENIETSRELGEPIELYLFRYGDSPDHYFAFNDGEQSVERTPITYRPVPIKRTAIAISGTLDKAALTVHVPSNSGVPELFRVYAPSSVVTLEIFQGHTNDPDDEFLLCWSGRVINCRWVGREALLTCEPSTTSLKRTGLRRNYQYGCPHALYDPDTCRASEAAATTSAIAQVIEGNVVTCSVSGNNDYAGGKLKWTQGNNRKEIRTIVRVIDGKLVLSGIPIGLTVGMDVEMVKGCDHSLNGCVKHNNVLNYGGMPWIPLKNPLSNSSPFR